MIFIYLLEQNADLSYFFLGKLGRYHICNYFFEFGVFWVILHSGKWEFKWSFWSFILYPRMIEYFFDWNSTWDLLKKDFLHWIRTHDPLFLICAWQKRFSWAGFEPTTPFFRQYTKIPGHFSFRDTSGTRRLSPGQSRPFRDGWQLCIMLPWISALVKGDRTTIENMEWCWVFCDHTICI